MKKRKKLTIDLEVVRELTKPELERQAGGTSYTIWTCWPPAPSDRCTLDYDATCFSCEKTYCNQACSMDACPGS